MPGDFPNDENGQVLFTLQSRGDDLSTPRAINFHFVFPTRNQAIGFIELITDKDVRLELSWYMERQQWQCTAVKVMVPRHDEISQFEVRLTDLAEPLQGVPDGWGCIVIKAEKISDRCHQTSFLAPLVSHALPAYDTRMVKLTREVRFSLTSDFERQIAPGRAINSWGGWPAALAAAPFLAVRVTVAGEPDPVTGMLCNISAIDSAVRTAGFEALAATRDMDASVLLALLANAVVDALAATPQPRESESGSVATLSESTEEISVTNVELLLTPTIRLEMSIANPNRVLLTQQFEFAAAHRLHCEDYTEEENRRVFGKCNNPGGHGHNYILDITLATTPDDLQGRVISLTEFEKIVRREVIDPYDHEHLNCEDDFAGMNPTVENIAKVIWGKLHGKFSPAQLHRVRVHETSKTMAEYGGE